MVRAHDYKNLPGLWSEPLNITTSADGKFQFKPEKINTILVSLSTISRDRS